MRGERQTAGPEQPLRGVGGDQRDQRAPCGHGRVHAAEQRRRDRGLYQASRDQQQAGFDRHRRRVPQGPAQRVSCRPRCSAKPCLGNPELLNLNGFVNSQLSGVDPGLLGTPKSATVAFGALYYVMLQTCRKIHNTVSTTIILIILHREGGRLAEPMCSISPGTKGARK